MALDSAASHIETAYDAMRPTVLTSGFLARIEDAAQVQQYAALNTVEVSAVRVVFAQWEFDERTIKGIPYYLADRALQATIQAPELGGYQRTGHRVVAPKESRILMIAQGALQADDVACLCQIERRALGLPQPGALREPGEATQPLKLDALTQQAVWLLGTHSKAEIASQLGVTPGAIGKRIVSAMQRNNYEGNEAGFIKHAFLFGQIDTGELPPATGAVLSVTERTLLGQHSLSTIAQAAAEMGVPLRVIEDSWKTITVKLGVRQLTRGSVGKSRMEAYLVALRDGLLDEPDTSE